MTMQTTTQTRKQATSHCANLVVGMGDTGFSCLRYLLAHGEETKVFDDSFSEDKLSKLKEISENVEYFDSGEKNEKILAGIDRLVVSPGVPLAHPLVVSAKEKALGIVGDIELFCLQNNLQDNKPVIAVTGSNGKSTVVTMLGLMAEAQGIKARVVGNIGSPALDSLDDETEMYILELSSFQLDTTSSLRAAVAVVLNLSQDHLDRYDSYDAYKLSKQVIYKNCQTAIYNLDDPDSKPVSSSFAKTFSFGLSEDGDKHFGLKAIDGSQWITFASNKIMAVRDLRLQEPHQITNALACLAIGSAAGFEIGAMIAVLRSFSGLPHRCELIRRTNDVAWYNDSKGTNVGACVAAIKSLSREGKKNIILIAGGESKGAALRTMLEPIDHHVKFLLLIGKDAQLFVDAFSEQVESKICKDMAEAVAVADSLSAPEDVVLLSPACSSLDMYNNYLERGDHFRRLVNGLQGGLSDETAGASI